MTHQVGELSNRMILFVGILMQGVLAHSRERSPARFRLAVFVLPNFFGAFLTTP